MNDGASQADEEILDAVKALLPSKAPGIDVGGSFSGGRE